jgi:1,4-alpha-glucan branching enzyme
MGNEFGHPEWIDFPREGNDFSYRHARRQWHLCDDPALYFHCLSTFDREILTLMASHNLLLDGQPRKLSICDASKVLIFQRDDLLFLFNFHTQLSLSDYAVVVPPGQYRGVLDTDERRFGGQGRIAHQQEYPVDTQVRGAERCLVIRVYLPCRTALVLQRMP